MTSPHLAVHFKTIKADHANALDLFHPDEENKMPDALRGTYFNCWIELASTGYLDRVIVSDHNGSNMKDNLYKICGKYLAFYDIPTFPIEVAFTTRPMM